jgi:serine/threonine protein kinase
MMFPSGIGSLASYENLEQVGEGTYGYVYRARDKRDGSTVALKRLIIHKENLGFPLCAVREIKFLKSLSHPNIVLLRDVATSKGCENLDTAIVPDPSKAVAAAAAAVAAAAVGEKGTRTTTFHFLSSFIS